MPTTTNRCVFAAALLGASFGLSACKSGGSQTGPAPDSVTIRALALPEEASYTVGDEKLTFRVEARGGG